MGGNPSWCQLWKTWKSEKSNIYRQHKFRDRTLEKLQKK